MRRLMFKTKKKKKSAQRRKRGRSGFDRRWLTGGALAAGILATLAGAGWLWTSGWVERQATAAVAQFHESAVAAGLGVTDVLVEGRQRSQKHDLLAAVGVNRGASILGLDLDQARANLLELPWVADAEIERRLPGVVFISLSERRPMALWQLDGRVSVIDRDGLVIKGIDPSHFAELPLVVGPGAPGHAGELIALLEREPGLKQQVIAAVWVGRRRWNLNMTGGIDVRLPETGAGKAWSHFARMERKHGLLKRDVVAIDLRMPDRLVVRVDEEKGARSAVPTAGNNT